MTTVQRNARIAGLLYLLLTLVAPLRLLYIPGKLFVRGDAAATAANIAANETLFRLGIMSELACGVIVLFLTFALYRLFRDVDHQLAVLVVIVGGILPAAVDFLIVLNDIAALAFVSGADYLAAFDAPQRDALAHFFMRLHGQQVLAAEVLWGIWLFPLGMLAIRSRFIPRLFGYWLIINGIAYLALSVSGLVLPQYAAWVEMVTIPALLGEVAFMLWLLIKGARERPVTAG
ncbi:MAG: DUF4386 domain-containing protein [Candidatus Krumholzibacteria bacterium]|nr:DUF4386 domain-containing protein [Candidatus Krumholzibacteria bacterium]MDH4338353.1 DUF4386 domain-containing protein [Candidatus Krumholzibacteria bacterium]MDH5269803.1 DUF4386 domain-containing protein [Candidatus Krumholzibacteria bacterium]MDH5628402.1 DUF4386 domain-containing protein [Candidatus Krumholzibacteria bacterium]